MQPVKFRSCKPQTLINGRKFSFVFVLKAGLWNFALIRDDGRSKYFTTSFFLLLINFIKPLTSESWREISGTSTFKFCLREDWLNPVGVYKENFPYQFLFWTEFKVSGNVDLNDTEPRFVRTMSVKLYTMFYCFWYTLNSKLLQNSSLISVNV